MEEFLIHLLGFVVPALIVFATGYFTLKKYLDFEQTKILLTMKKEIKAATIPLRLQAFERITLFLERISPNSLILRMNRPGMSAKQFHSALIGAIRNEYDHNLSQQLYVSNLTWATVKKAKEEMTRVVNVGAAKVKPNATSLDLSKMIFKLIAELGQNPSDIALMQLKNELRKTF
ncbi:MAG: hypothetical protein HRT71_07305 [Flavobacteriales bacterium]|nr:hypothetical protein [Flavobacteriales bacterium]